MKKKIIAMVLTATAVMSCSSALAANYSDVSTSAWYYNYVNKISELKAFAGYEAAHSARKIRLRRRNLLRRLYA